MRLNHLSSQNSSKDKLKISNYFANALLTYDKQALAQQQINRRLCLMLQKCAQQPFDLALEIGCGSGNLTCLLHQQYSIQSWWLNDLNTEALARTATLLQQNKTTSVNLLATDAEQFESTLLLKQQFDLLISASTVQWFQQPQRFIQLAEQGLKTQGILLFSTFLPNNLLEIKQLTDIGLTYPTQQQWLQWLQPHFELLSLDSQIIRLYFDHPSEVLQHLKATGVTATHRKFWTKGKLSEFYRRYQQLFSIDKKVYLTYSPLLILAKRK